MVNTIYGSDFLYLYAVIPGTAEKDLGLEGLFDAHVYTLVKGHLAVVVSELPRADTLRPERKHIAAHQEVLRHLVQNNRAVLPFAFGTISDTPGVHEILSRHQQSFQKQIRKTASKVQLEIKVVYEVPDLFEFFVLHHHKLKARREAVYDSDRAPDGKEVARLDRLFQQLLNDDRKKRSRAVESKLRPFCVELKWDRIRNKKEVMRISCLAAKSALKQLQAATEDAAALFDENFVFESDGPLPPYDFVEVVVKV